MIALLICSLAACGGGAEPASPLASASSGERMVVAAASGTALVAATTSAPAAQAPAGTSAALGTQGRVTLYGLPVSAPAAPRWPDASPAGRRFHIDSRLGDDGQDGLSPSRAWRSLARAATAPLAPGDRIVLACGSTWRETLRLSRSGTVARPVIVAAPDAGCSQPPTIDGSVELPPSAWTRQPDGRFRASLAQVPLQLFGEIGTWVEAHHPNRQPDGPAWLALAADGNVVNANGREVSTRLAVGDDLALPTGSRFGAGARVRVRTAAYVVDDLPVTGLQGRSLELAAPTTYPVKAGWGYLLTGQAWMVDSGGEWHHDASDGRLLVQAIADGGVAHLPTRATVLPIGIDLQGLAHVVIDGVQVRHTGTGALLRGCQGVRIRNARFEDMADRGIDAADSRGTVVESTELHRTGADALFAGGIAAVAAEGLVARDNLIRESGVRLANGAIASLPRRSYGTILAGRSATVTGNVIVDSAYIGIRVFERSLVEGNVVIGSCTVLDDCGAIYTLGAANGSRIAANLVLDVRGNAGGKPAAARAAQAHGIYLDDDAAGVTVDGNTVIAADHGLLLHDAADSTVTGNRLYGNRIAQLWLQETRRRADGLGTMRGLVIDGNQFAPVHPLSRSWLIETLQASAAAFGLFDHNRYFDAVPGRIGTIGTAVGARDHTALSWFATPGLASPGRADAAGSASSGDGHAGLAISGGNRIPNGDLATGTQGWSSWSASAPQGRMQRLNCDGQPCLRYTGGGGSGLLSSPNFSVEQGRWYRLSVDIAGDAEGQILQLIVRRGGGGSNGYESLADRDLSVLAGTRMQRHVVVFQATKTVRAADPLTGDLGARIDLEGVTSGRNAWLARLEVVPVELAAMPRLSIALVNAGVTSLDVDCPLPAAQAALCNALVDLGDAGAARENRRTAWPLRLAPRSAVLLRGFDPSLTDSDGDGIADAQDACPGTPARQAVNAAGCALGQ